MHYSLVAVDFMSEHALHAALSRVAAAAGSGSIRPLPQVMHSLSAVVPALRQMSQARHVGKVVVRASCLAIQESGTSGTGMHSYDLIKRRVPVIQSKCT